MSKKPDRIQITTGDVALYNRLTRLAQCKNPFFKLFGRKWFIERLDMQGGGGFPYEYAATLNSVVEMTTTADKGTAS